MIRLFIAGVVCLALVALPPEIYGEENSFLTINQLIGRAMQENAELHFYKAEVDATKGQRTQAGLWKNPEFTGEYGSRRIMDSSGALQNDGTTRSFSVTQTFEFPGKGSLRKAIANKNTELAELGLKQFQLALAGKVRALALEYLLASDNADVAGEISERSTGLVKMLQTRPLGGTQQLLELRVIEGNLIELQKQAKEFAQAREEARIELNALLGYPASYPLKIGRELGDSTSLHGDLNSVVMSGFSNNLQLKTRILELEKAVKEVSAAKLDAIPNFSVGPFFSQDRAGDTEENFGATVSVTLPLWDWNQGNIATAKARRAQADSLLLDAKRKVEVEITRQYRSVEFNQNQLEEISETSLSSLREAADLADRQYRTGGVNVQLFIEMQRQFMSASQIRNEALLKMWKSRLDLELLTGADFFPSNETKAEGKK